MTQLLAGHQSPNQEKQKHLFGGWSSMFDPQFLKELDAIATLSINKWDIDIDMYDTSDK